MQFIVPTQPKLRSSPPTGDGWIHEAKFDGWRIQLHKHGDLVRLYTKSGYDCTKQFGTLTSALCICPRTVLHH
jgi:bifunctional non-homologous end joining protein LigD